MKRSVRGHRRVRRRAVAGRRLAASGAPAASAEDNGVGATPAMGWSSWSFIRHNPTAQNIEATGQGHEGQRAVQGRLRLRQHRRLLVPVPRQPGPERRPVRPLGHRRDQVPASGRENGIQVVADYVHSLGLKFGLYVTPGISKQAVAQNTAIEGTPYHADDIATTAAEKNYNCKGMVGHRLHQARRAGLHQLLGRPVRLLGRGLRQDRRRRHPGHPGRAGLVGRAEADRPPDPPGAVQQPGHQQRADLGASCPTAGAPAATSSATAARRTAAATR